MKVFFFLIVLFSWVFILKLIVGGRERKEKGNKINKYIYTIKKREEVVFLE